MSGLPGEAACRCGHPLAGHDSRYACTACGCGAYQAARERVQARSWVEEMTEDDGWFTRKAAEFAVMDRDALLNEARTWAFNARQAKLEELAVRRWAGTETRDLRRAAARVAALVNVQAKSLKMDDLRCALADCQLCRKPATAIWKLHVFACAACAGELDRQAGPVPPAGPAPLPGM